MRRSKTAPAVRGALVALAGKAYKRPATAGLLLRPASLPFAASGTSVPSGRRLRVLAPGSSARTPRLRALSLLRDYGSGRRVRLRLHAALFYSSLTSYISIPHTTWTIPRERLTAGAPGPSKFASLLFCTFEDRGERELKGVSETVRLFGVCWRDA